MSGLFYMQDSRSIVGNDMVWWSRGGKGYTCNIINAEVYEKEEAIKMHESRHSDVPWPKDYIDARIKPVIDHQRCIFKEAHKNTGIKRLRDKLPRKPVFHCIGCGIFLSVIQCYGRCPKCGTDNTP